MLGFSDQSRHAARCRRAGRGQDRARRRAGHPLPRLRKRARTALLRGGWVGCRGPGPRPVGLGRRSGGHAGVSRQRPIPSERTGSIGSHGPARIFRVLLVRPRSPGIVGRALRRGCAHARPCAGRRLTRGAAHRPGASASPGCCAPPARRCRGRCRRPAPCRDRSSARAQRGGHRLNFTRTARRATAHRASSSPDQPRTPWPVSRRNNITPARVYPGA